jgi:hypothetical protein
METEDEILRSEECDGILGMGLENHLWGSQTTAEYPYVPTLLVYRPTPVFQNMIEHELVSLSVFSFYFTR